MLQLGNNEELETGAAAVSTPSCAAPYNLSSLVSDGVS